MPVKKLLLIIAAILYALLTAWWLMPTQQPQEWTPAQKKVLVEKMKRHGVTVCECQRGACWFYDGKGRKCRL